MNNDERPEGQLTDVATGQNLLTLRDLVAAAWTQADVGVVNAIAYNRGSYHLFHARRAALEDIMFKLDNDIMFLGVKRA